LKEIKGLKGSVCLRYASLITLLLLRFFLKFNQDALIVTIPIISYYVFDWAAGLRTCIILSALGLAALLTNYLIRKIDFYMYDRAMLLGSLFACSVGVLMVIDVVNRGVMAVYVVGFFLTFVGIELMEIPLTILIAKTTPAYQIKNFWNSSFLVTFLGTAGRFFGCFFVAAIGLLHPPIDEISNYIFIPIFAILLLLFILTNCTYEQLKSSVFYHTLLVEENTTHR